MFYTSVARHTVRTCVSVNIDEFFLVVIPKYCNRLLETNYLFSVELQLFDFC